MRASLALVLNFLLFCSVAAAADYYEALGLKRGAGTEEIRRAYHRLAMRYYPDRHSKESQSAAAAKFKEVALAYEILSDPIRKNLYDRGLPLDDGGASAAQAARPGRRMESGFYDPTGIASLNNTRLNFLHDIYLDFRKTRSPADALIAAMRQERGTSRANVWGADAYESQTKYVFGIFIDEVMEDLFYSGQDVQSPVEHVLIDAAEQKNEASLILSPKALTLSRLPNVDQIMEINKLYGGEGYYDLVVRSIKEARSKADLFELFNYEMHHYWADNYLYFPDEQPGANVWDTRKHLVNMLEPAVARLYPTGTPVAECFADFIREKLAGRYGAGRRLAQNLFAVIANIGTPETYEVVRRLASDSEPHRFIRSQANQALEQMDEPRKPGRQSTGAYVNFRDRPSITLTLPTEKRLHELLRAGGDPHERMRAALRLSRAHELTDEDIANLVKAVLDFYGGYIKQSLHIWRLGSNAWDKDKGNGPIRKESGELLLELYPTHPNVLAALAMMVRAEREYAPVGEILDVASKHRVQDPVLLAAIKDLARSQWHHRYRSERAEAIGYLGEWGDPEDAELTSILQAITQLEKSNSIVERGWAHSAEKSLRKLKQRKTAVKVAERDTNLLITPEHPALDRLDSPTVLMLRQILATPPSEPFRDTSKDVQAKDVRFDAATRLYEAGELSPADIQNLGELISHYSWRYRSYGFGGSTRVVHTLLKLLPTHPEVVPMLVRAMERGWGYPAEEIAVAAMEHGIRDPGLLEALRQVLVEWPDGCHPEQVPLVQALGRLGDPNNPKLIETLRRKANFHYTARAPEPEGYEAAIAIARLGVGDAEAVEWLRGLMRENENKFTGSGVPFAAALSFLGIHDAEVIALLQRELTHNPNGEREHDQVARQALESEKACHLKLLD